MPSVIKHFMWGYQQHFCVGQECVSKRVFELLDERLAPEVFLVGILVEDRENSFPACVEPELDFWAKSNVFDSALALAEKIRKGYPEREILHSDPLAQKWHDEGLFRRSVEDAIQSIIENSDDKPHELSYFVAYPANVEGYLVSVVLGLQTTILKEHPSLKKDSVPIHKYRSIPVPTSLIDAVTSAYLDRASGELRLPNPGCGFSELNAEDIVREGANRLMRSLAYRAAPDCFDGWHRFLSSCTNVACTNYERVAGEGTMVLANRDHVSLQKVVQFRILPKLGVTRAARKLLQLAAQDLALHTNSDDLYGLVKVRKYKATKEDLFYIRFIEHHHWQVLHEGKVLMGVRYGQPYLTKPPYDEDKLKKDLPRIFHGMTGKNVQRILSLVREAEKESHGTMLIISKGAKKESIRLAAQGTPIVPKVMTSEVIRNLIPIDGAVLLNPKGTCYAVGVILDGMAREEGSSARGARYNSAIRYVMSSKFHSLAVIISEDGGVDFFPDLRPMIRRSEIESTIRRLRALLEKKSVNCRKYNEIMDWLDKNRFYLLSDHCRNVNELMASIEEKSVAEDPMALRIVRRQFDHHPEMDTELYYEPEALAPVME